jgi:O-antigen/teichoic acid export membrane protein
VIPVVTTRRSAATRPCSCPVPLPCECSYRTLVRARARSLVRRSAGEPLVRNGHVLAASSVLAAIFGSLFWIFATRWYSAETVGTSYAALSAAALMSGIGRFNLGDVLVRFVPRAGRHTGRLVLRCYLISGGLSALAAGCFLLLIPDIAPSLDLLRTPVLAISFVIAAAGYSIFDLQDGALTGLRRTGWVLGENLLFAAAKAAVLAACAALAIGTGILVSWAAALLLSVVVTNVVLFRHAIPAHHRADTEGAPVPRRVMRYAVADYLGKLASIVTYTVLPLMVLSQLGAAQNAYYSLAWIIADTFDIAVFAMGASLVVEGAHEPGRLAEHARRMLRHAGLLVLAATVVVVAAAPWILSLFGPAYAENGTPVLRLMALASLPTVLLTVAIDVARVRRNLGRLVGLQVAHAVLVIGLTIVLLPLYGLTGVGLAWLIACCAVALPLLLTMPRWIRLPEGSRP